jgi:hypothetical protein
VEIVNFGLVIRPGLIGAIGKYRAQTVNRQALPGAHLVRMYLVTASDLLDRPVATQRLKGNLGFETSRKSAPFRHICIPPQRAEYTLTYCPIFWDHLSHTRWIHISSATPELM